MSVGYFSFFDKTYYVGNMWDPPLLSKACVSGIKSSRAIVVVLIKWGLPLVRPLFWNQCLIGRLLAQNRYAFIAFYILQVRWSKGRCPTCLTQSRCGFLMTTFWDKFHSIQDYTSLLLSKLNFPSNFSLMIPIFSLIAGFPVGIS